MLKIADSNPSPTLKGVIEERSEPKDPVTNVPTADATGKDINRWLESVQCTICYLMKIKVFQMLLD